MTSDSRVRPVRAHRIVGVIGGMGPEATVDLLRRVIDKTPAQADADHVHMIVESNPKIPSRLAHLLDHSGPDPSPELARIAENLERAGADALAMPCNTAHAYAGAVRNAVSIPLIDMVQITAAQVSEGGPRRVGLLASSAVHKVRLYEEAFATYGVQTMMPTDQDAVMRLIRGVKAGLTGPGARAALAAVAKDLYEHADAVLVACSELSVIATDIREPFVDSLDVLAARIVAFARPN
jgi:aspartate racemase